ncbi:MAG TPA: hypothetical protein VF267_13355 [Gammaproteobacteria bacterium]
MDEIERKAKAYARRYYAELRKAGLASWSFEEFFDFCRPHAIKVVTSDSHRVCEPASVAAARISDAVSEAFEARFGKPLSLKARNQVFLVARKSVVASHRSRLRLT